MHADVTYLTHAPQGKLAELRARMDALNAGLFRPARGEMQVAACDAALRNGGYYGPFVDAQVGSSASHHT